MKIVITYNRKRKPTKGKPKDYYSEFDDRRTIEALTHALKRGGNKVSLLEVNKNVLSYFKNKRSIDIVFNIAEGLSGDSRESQIPAILDLLNIPYVGSGVLSLALALDKARAKKLFRYDGIPTPNFQLFNNIKERLNSSLKFPLIVKPNREGSSKGIFASNVVTDITSLYQRVKKVFFQYHQEVLVEEFVEGREVSVGILGNDSLFVLPLLEIDFQSCSRGGEFFYSWRVKEYQGNDSLYLSPTFSCPAPLRPDLSEKIRLLACRAYRSLGCLDFARIDFRIDRFNQPYVLEVNPLPGLDPYESNLTLMANAAGLDYEKLIQRILTYACHRYRIV
jgi:D-alanine-D-alanine ligase